MLRIPTDILNKAAQDSSSPEAIAVKKLQNDVANMHAGEQAYTILPSDRDEKGHYLFDMKLVGIEGAGKQFDISAAINERKKSILDAFGAGFMALGNEGGGSYALMDGKTTVHEAFVGRDIDFIVSVIQTQLFPQLLAINGWKLTQNEMPRMVPAGITDKDIEGTSKMIQRVFSANAIPRTKETINETLDKLDYEYRIPESISDEDFEKLFTDNRSRAGDGLKTAGEGTSTSVAGQDDPAVGSNE